MAKQTEIELYYRFGSKYVPLLQLRPVIPALIWLPSNIGKIRMMMAHRCAFGNRLTYSGAYPANAC
jgi:hypothetical protein